MRRASVGVAPYAQGGAGEAEEEGGGGAADRSSKNDDPLHIVLDCRNSYETHRCVEQIINRSNNNMSCLWLLSQNSPYMRELTREKAREDAAGGIDIALIGEEERGDRHMVIMLKGRLIRLHTILGVFP